MKGLLWLLVLFALAVGVSLGLHLNDGVVLIVVPPWRVELQLSLALIALAAAFVVFYGVLRGLAATRALPRRVREFRERRQQAQEFERLTDAVRLQVAGQHAGALAQAEAAHAAGQSPALAALLAAQAALAAGKIDAARDWLARAEASDRKMAEACRVLAAGLPADQATELSTNSSTDSAAGSAGQR